MAKLSIPEQFSYWAAPYCSGCGVTFEFLPYGLSSKDNGERFSKAMALQGSMGRQVMEFAKRHEQCPERVPKVSVTSDGVTVKDYRAWRDVT